MFTRRKTRSPHESVDDPVDVSGRGSLSITACSAGLVALALIPGCLTLSAEREQRQVSAVLGTRARVTLDWQGEAPERDPAAPLSAGQAVRLALHHNPRIRELMAQIAAARADRVQATLLPNPVINYAYGFPIDGGGGAPAMASLVQQLAWLWELPARRNAAVAELRRQVLEVSDTALRLVAKTRAAHARLVHAERVVAHDEAILALLEGSRDLLAERFEVGEATQEQVNLRDLAVLEVRDRLLGSRAALATRERELLELLGESPLETRLVIDGELPTPVEKARREGDVIELVTTQRLDVAAAYAGVEGADARTRLARLGWIPGVSVGVGYQRNFENRDGVFPSLGVTPKLFDTGRTAQARAEAIAQRTLAAADALLQEAVREARVAWVGVESTRERLAQHRGETLPLRENDADLARRAFEAGTADRLAVNRAEVFVATARRQLDDRSLELALRQIELERAVGGSLEPQPRELSLGVSGATPEAEAGP